ncbi:MAG: class I SAM-dependent methyltransferase [Burkholderiaceae bacterium]|jgi:hypothetical protein|nr:class I SAM-dependent methyltransferase [Burkholderiaceae bacterium]
MSENFGGNSFSMKLDEANFADSFGVSLGDLPARCKKLIADKNFEYNVLKGNELESFLVEILKRIDEDTQKIGVEERKDVWERGWRESLDEYVQSNFDIKKLVPKFIRPNQAIRWQQQYILPVADNFELDYVEVLREWLFPAYFSEVDTIHEFGCGTGFNLLALARIYPEKNLIGSDFVPASVELVNKIAEKQSLNLRGHIFDMIQPNENYEVAENSGVLTFGSLEQLAGKFENFIDFLLRKKPEICVHIEPTIELYDENVLSDYLAIRFQSKRGYTKGLLPHLSDLASQGNIELLKVKRLNFGSQMMEGYNLMVWRPVKV